MGNPEQSLENQNLKEAGFFYVFTYEQDKEES